LDHTLAFAGFNIPRLERFCAANFWDANAGTRFLVPNHALKLIVDNLGITSVIYETFTGAVIEVEVVIDRTVLLDTQAFSGNDIPRLKLIVAVLQFPPARAILRRSFSPPVELAWEADICAWC
jgi:hypothetical protein